eukprot:TRINITY_DN3490_c0_g1_i4.p1 TRINITY_DN3490_c0_g1~~TRINITY_DN3490_c0_g1_i4.p1  ORF type:complete len:802 (-),score=263.84 TRINITY_DN3490_c0_g1_i4:42-2447(-)
MGVQKLWDILSPAGRRVTMEALAHKRLAIDASIWLIGFEAMKETKGAIAHVRNSHIIAIFNRICKLLFYGIKPIFVFDGATPALKKKTVETRRMLRDKRQDTIAVKRAAQKLLKQTKEYHSQNSQPSDSQSQSSQDDPIVIPDEVEESTPSSSRIDLSDYTFDDLPEEEPSTPPIQHDFFSAPIPVDDYSIDEVDEDVFQSLPPELQMEVLKDMNHAIRIENRAAMQSRATSSPGDFSKHQLDGFLKTSQLHRQLRSFSDTDGSPSDVAATRFQMLRSYSDADKFKNSPSSQDEIFQVEDFQVELTGLAGKEEVEEDEVPLLSKHERLQGSKRKLEFSKKSPEKIPREDPISLDSDEALETPLDLEKDIEFEISVDTSKLNDIAPNDLFDASLFDDLPPKPAVKETIDLLDESSETDTDPLPKTPPQTHIQTPKPLTETPVTAKPALPKSSPANPSTSWVPRNEINNKHQSPFTPLQFSDSLEKQMEVEALMLAAQQRHAPVEVNSLSVELFAECQDLLHLFGVPYVISPTEAEAQCAALEQLELVDGVITEDSDIWLFGGHKVYRHVFKKNKDIEFYERLEIKRKVGLDRTEMIKLALLLGSDYTEGVGGVGPVTGMEIIHEFPGEDGLVKFRDWIVTEELDADFKDVKDVKEEHDTDRLLRLKANCKKMRFPGEFPSRMVIDGYVQPNVDNSPEKFSWSRPNLDALRSFAAGKFGWEQSRTDDILLPILKKWEETFETNQNTIPSYFSTEVPNSMKSKRVKNVILEMTGKKAKEKSKGKKATKPRAKKSATAHQKPMLK